MTGGPRTRSSGPIAMKDGPDHSSHHQRTARRPRSAPSISGATGTISGSRAHLPVRKYGGDPEYFIGSADWMKRQLLGVGLRPGRELYSSPTGAGIAALRGPGDLERQSAGPGSAPAGGGHSPGDAGAGRKHGQAPRCATLSLKGSGRSLLAPQPGIML